MVRGENMGKVESTIKAEIMREVHSLRLKLSGLTKNFTTLDRLAKDTLQEQAKKKMELQASPEEVKASRLTPQRIRLLRTKLGISQKDIGILLGVSIGAVGMWEKGKFAPSVNKKAALIALRKLKKREVRKLLAEKKQEIKEEKAGQERAKKAVRKRIRAMKKGKARPKAARKK
jgi:DNA-binding transcriptional regulator YiaG